jgi:hypothetical protein
MVIENLFDDDKYRLHLSSKGYVLWKILPPNDGRKAARKFHLPEKLFGR